MVCSHWPTPTLILMDTKFSCRSLHSVLSWTTTTLIPIGYCTRFRAISLGLHQYQCTKWTHEPNYNEINHLKLICTSMPLVEWVNILDKIYETSERFRRGRKEKTCRVGERTGNSHNEQHIISVRKNSWPWLVTTIS